MAITFITININQSGATQALMLKNAVNLCRQTYTQLATIRAQMSNMNDGTVFTRIETEFGLASGKGQAMYDLINGAVGAMEGTFQNNNGKSLGELSG